MKKLIILISIFSSSFFLFAQEETDVLVQTNSVLPIPYAKVYLEGKDYYKNTDTKGKLKLEKGEKISRISATGFEDFFPSDNQKEYILIAKKQKESTEVFPKNKVKITMGKLDKKTNLYFQAGATGLTQAQYIPFKNDYPETAFIKSISFLSSFPIKRKNEPIILRLYKNDNGQPGESYLAVDFVVQCKPGRSINKVDLSKNHIVFPKEGLFIGLEWINIPSNIAKFDYVINRDGSKTRADKLDLKSTIIEPAIAYEFTNEDDNFWILSNNGWKKPKLLSAPSKISFEIVITD